MNNKPFNKAAVKLKFIFSINNPGRDNMTIGFTLPSYFMIKVLRKIGSDVELPIPPKFHYTFPTGTVLAYRGYGKYILYAGNNPDAKLMFTLKTIITAVNELRDEMGI